MRTVYHQLPHLGGLQSHEGEGMSLLVYSPGISGRALCTDLGIRLTYF